MSDAITTSQPAGQKEESLLWNLACNILIPTILLTKGNSWYQWIIGKIAEMRGWDSSLLQSWEDRKTLIVLLIALLFPLGYGLRDLWQRKKCNLFSVVGLLNVGLTGIVGFFAMDSFWIAVKEATVPLIFGLAILVSMRSPTPLVRTLFLNEKLLRHDKIQEALQEHDNQAAFLHLEKEVTWILCGSFLLSALLNFVLARLIVTSPGGSEAFNAEIGKMTALSWPVIVVPSMIITVFALWRLFHKLGQLTGLKLEDMMQDPKANKKAEG